MFNFKRTVGIDEDDKVVVSSVNRPQHHVQLRHSPKLERSNFTVNTGNIGTTVTSTPNSVAFNIRDGMLTGVIPSSLAGCVPYFRDIYYHDPTAGAVADIWSTLPFSPFMLDGLTDAQEKVYLDSMEWFIPEKLLPELSIAHLVEGVVTATFLYNDNKRKFTEFMVHDTENIEITTTPLYSAQPLLKLYIDGNLKSFLESRDPYIIKLRNEQIPQKMLKALLENESVTLDPVTTLFLPRRTFPKSGDYTSLYTRILSFYFLEKVLYRGTLTEANRRQKSLLHITAGMAGFWEPTEDELKDIVSIFQSADLDPLGAIIATRDSINTSEIRNHGDFWSYNDLSEQLLRPKLRAMCVSEALLSDTTTYQSTQVEVSVIMDQLEAYRNKFANTIFTRGLFPNIAKLNGFYHNKGGDKGKLETGRYIDRTDKFHEYSKVKGNENSNLIIPTINWLKKLRPAGNTTALETLRTLTELGVPITLGLIAATGGVSLTNIEAELEEDKKLRELIAKVKPKKKEDDSGGGSDFSFSSVEDAKKYIELNSKPINKVGLVNRQYEEEDLKSVTPTGKPKSIYNQRKARNNKFNMYAKVLKSLSDPHEYAKTKKISRRISKTRPSPGGY